MRTLHIVIYLLLAATTLHAQDVRIITAGSAITETVCALGDCDKIVASDRTSMYPSQIQQLPSIGYRSGINAEGILSLKPTLVIVEKDYVEESLIQQLASTGLKLVVVDRKYNVADTRRFIAQIATALGRDAEGKKVIAKLDADLAEAKAALDKKTSTPKVLCIYNRGAATVSAAGTDTFAEILAYCGAQNAFGNIEGYKPLNTESVIEANPDYLLMLSSGFQSIGGVEGAINLPGIALTTAGKKKQIVSIESLKLTNFGPRFGEAARELVYLLHPELRAK